MTYTRNAVYNSVANAVKTAYPNTFCTSRYVAKPPSFPACYIHEIDRMRTFQGTQLDFKDVQWESVFEVQVVSAKEGSAASEAYAIMDEVRNALNRLYYRETSETNIDSFDTFVIVGRFRRVIGGGDEMPIEETGE